MSLHVDVPVQNVCSFWVLIDIAVANFVGIETDIGIYPAAERSRRIETDYLEGSRGGSIQPELIRQGENIEYSKPAANGGLSVLEWIPGKSDAGFKVFRGRIAVDETIHMLRTTRAGWAWCDSGCGAIHNRCDFLDSVVGIFRESCEFVPDAHIDCQIGNDPPIVLNIAGK